MDGKKPMMIAAELNLAVKDVNNIKKKLGRRLDDYMQCRHKSLVVVKRRA